MSNAPFPPRIVCMLCDNLMKRLSTEDCIFGHTCVNKIEKNWEEVSLGGPSQPNHTVAVKTSDEHGASAAELLAVWCELFGWLGY